MEEELSSILLSGTTRDDIDVGATVTLHSLESSLKDIREALSARKEALAKLVDGNRTDFTNYRETLCNLEKMWKPLEMESARRALYGNLNAIAMTAMLEELKGMKDRRIETTTDEYITYTVNELGKRANELARLPDYEKCLAQEHQCDYIINVVISQKTQKFARMIKEALSNLPEDSFHVIYKVCCIYLEVFQASFSSQLFQLPHLAALYFNDARYLSLLCRIKCVVDVNQCENLELHGVVVLQKNLEKIKSDIREMLPLQTWQVRYGQLDDAALWSVMRTLEQAHLRLCQLHKVLSPILDEDLFASKMNSLVEIVLIWLWKGLLSVKSISRETISLLSDVVQFASKLFNDALGSENAAKWPNKQCSQLTALLRISQQNIIQVSNAFRRDDFISTLDHAEFHSVVNILFPDTAMKAAFLAEIEAEIS